MGPFGGHSLASIGLFHQAHGTGCVGSLIADHRRERGTLEESLSRWGASAADQQACDSRNVAVNIRQSIVPYGHADSHTNDAGL